MYFLRVYLSTRLDLIHCIVLFNFIINVTSILNCRIIILTHTFLMNYPPFWLILNKTCLPKKVCEYFNSNLNSAGRQRHSRTERQKNRGTRIKGEIQSGWGKTPGPDNIKGLEAMSSGWNLCIERYINIYITTVMTDNLKRLA